MPEEKKGLSTFQLIVGIATIIGAIAFLVKIFGGGEEGETKRSVKRSRKKTYGNLTYQDFQYKDWAEVLVGALVSSEVEDEQAVYDVFEKQKTIGDINKLIEYFGTEREMYTATWSTLPMFISRLFSKAEKKKLNGIISGNGIDYSFE